MCSLWCYCYIQHLDIIEMQFEKSAIALDLCLGECVMAIICMASPIIFFKSIWVKVWFVCNGWDKKLPISQWEDYHRNVNDTKPFNIRLLFVLLLLFLTLTNSLLINVVCVRALLTRITITQIERVIWMGFAGAYELIRIECVFIESKTSALTVRWE